MNKDVLLERLRPYAQEHLLAFWDELDEAGCHHLATQIESLDLPLVQSLFRGEEDAIDWLALAAGATGPRAIRKDDSALIPAQQAMERGEAALRAGEVGMILVAGGQGTRLGFDQPKGMFELGPVSRRTLFQILVDRLRAVAKRFGVSIPLYLMTSAATHQPTIDYFERHDRLGLSRDELHVFCQGVMPALDGQTGRILLKERNELLLSPDGHGGMLAALHGAGFLQDAKQRGVRLFFYGQVDNPLLLVCDPYFLGGHLLSESEMTTQVVRKQLPEERVGNVVEIEGKTRIIEYSDLPAEAARRCDQRGELELWAGNLAVHAFDIRFLERASDSADVLPFHRAPKAAAYLDPDGVYVEPDTPNAVKFERFIFDLLPFASKTLVVEVEKDEAFAPVKNADGAASDTPAASRTAMIQRDRRLLREVGVDVANDTPVEIHPLWALDADEAGAKIPPGTSIDQPTYFTP